MAQDVVLYTCQREAGPKGKPQVPRETDKSRMTKSSVPRGILVARDRNVNQSRWAEVICGC